jgi:hypothetical protein
MSSGGIDRSSNIKAVYTIVAIGMSLAFAGSAIAADISGTWVLDVRFPNGAEEHPRLVLKQDGEKVTGTYSGALGDYAVTGTVKVNEVSITVPGKNVRGEPLVLVYTGTVKTATRIDGFLDLGSKGKATFSAAKR